MAQLVQQYKWPIPPIGVIIYNASGGTMYTDSANNRMYHTFTSNGSFTINQGQGGFADILVVGGGGAGGGGWNYSSFYQGGGGGGAGGVIYLQNVFFPQGNHTITVGNGAGWTYLGSTWTQGSAGQNSSIIISGTGAQYNAIGGGSAYGYSGGSISASPRTSGGSGGGGTQALSGYPGYSSGSSAGLAISDSVGNYTGVQGNNGGTANTNYIGSGFGQYVLGGGGGGATYNGYGSSGYGGQGAYYSFLTNLGVGHDGWVGGGGAGGSSSPLSISVGGQTGGYGGGANATIGTSYSGTGVAYANTGGGGAGGGIGGIGGAGSNGFVVINYRYQ
jgi:hypothetical protein